jgi:hypothetical protein
MAVAEAFVVERGGDQMILWTDTRFTGAHRFYERKGYVADGRTRDLYDLSNSVEFFLQKTLGWMTRAAARIIAAKQHHLREKMT